MLKHMEPQMISRSPTKAIRQIEVLQRTGLSRTTLWRRINALNFPAPFKLGGGRAVAWLEHEIDAWIECQAAARGK